MTELLETLERFREEDTFAIAGAGMGGLFATEHGMSQVLLDLGWAGPYFVEEGPPAIQRVHQDLLPWVDLATVNTYRANETPIRNSLERVGRSDPSPAEVAEEAERITAEAFGALNRAIYETSPPQPIVVLGSMGTMFDTDETERADVAPRDFLFEEHLHNAQRLVAHGADALLVETVGSGKEAVVMAEAAAETGQPVIVALNPHPQDGSLMYNGKDPVADVAQALMDLKEKRPAVIGGNCAAVNRLTETLEALGGVLPDNIPRIAYGQGYPPEAHGRKNWKWEEGADLPAYMKAARTWHSLGAVIIGGCCGTTEAYIRGLVQLRDAMRWGH